MTREILKDFEGERLVMSGIRDRISYNPEKTSEPKMLIRQVKVVGLKGIIDHLWINPPKKLVSGKGDNLAFSATVKKYLSMDDEGNHVHKFGVVSVKNVKIGRSRKEAVAMVEAAIAENKRKLEEAKRRREQKELEDEKDDSDIE